MKRNRLLQFGLIVVILTVQLFLVVLVRGVVRGTDGPSQGQVVPAEEPVVEVIAGTCRYGVATLGQGQVDWVDDLHAGWYLNFWNNAGPTDKHAEFVPMVTVHQDKMPDGTYLDSYTTRPALTESGLGLLIDLRPNALWIVGNEVDRGPDPGSTQTTQGDTHADVYARAYHDVYRFIKERNPDAQVAISALVEVTPGRFQ